MTNKIITSSDEVLLLRKFKESLVTVDGLNTLFNDSQKAVISDLFKKGYLETDVGSYLVFCSDSEGYREKEFEIIVVSNLGKLYLFILDNYEKVKTFVENLEKLNYSKDLINDYLLTQNLNESIDSILNLEKYKTFCNMIKLNSSITFQRLNYNQKIVFNEDSKRLIDGMLSVIDIGHCIYICNPATLFLSDMNLSNSLETSQINWDLIDIDKMFKTGEYKSFINPDYEEAFGYVQSHLTSENDTYLAVVENYAINFSEYYIVRGLIKISHDGYSLIFNPEYESAIPINENNKILRFSGYEVPLIYTLKRSKCLVR